MSKVALVTGNDTGVGKTRVAASLAKALSRWGLVRYVKVVETGVAEASDSDARLIEALAGDSVESTAVLRSYRAALAPVAAAARENAEMSLKELVAEALGARGPGWTIIEGAGGVAVPVDASGADWRDFATTLPADAVTLVVENRLGAINQMRLLEAYCSELSMPCGFWLNEVRPQKEEVIRTNEEALASVKIPTWATQRYGKEPKCMDFSWAGEVGQ